MRKVVLILFLFFLTTVLAHAQVNRVIKLKNGTIMYGEVISYADGQYIVNSPRYGKVRLKESNIVSIEDSTAKAVYKSIAERAPKETDPQADPGQQDLPTRADLQRVQNQPTAQYFKERLENDPGLQQDFQNLIENKEVMQTLTNPAVMKAIMQGDTQTLMRNKEFQNLINNPDMQKIIEKTLKNP